MFSRRPPTRPRPPVTVPVGLNVLAAEFAARELDQGPIYEPAQVVGERPPVEDRGLVIEPPPWAGQIPLVGLQEPVADTIPVGDPYDPPAPGVNVGPPLPVVPPKPPPPDWRQEEIDRIRRDRAEQGLDEENPRRHPPPERRPA